MSNRIRQKLYGLGILSVFFSLDLTTIRARKMCFNMEKVGRYLYRLSRVHVTVSSSGKNCCYALTFQVPERNSTSKCVGYHCI